MSNPTGNSVEWYTADQVLNGYDMHARGREAVYYSIWQSKSLRFGYNNGDVNEGRDILADNLQPLINNQVGSTYTIKFHPEPDSSGYITDRTPVMGSFNFKISEPYSQRVGQVQPIAQAPASKDDKLDKIINLLITQEQRIKALEEEETEIVYEDEEEESEEDQYTKAIGAVQNVERLINESPLLNDVYTHLRLGLRVLAKRFGVEPEQTNYSGSYNISGMSNTQQQTEGNAMTFTEMFGQLVQQFPELPNMLGKLHHVMVTDADMFKVVKKKLIDGVNSI